ncbi:hypothetical protein [Paenilisteria rocourtiae]|uniref:hypothetical protein n=1 Tax=Listeria rocourtiae TaxID=647910 RepID=UPI0004B1752D|nr:hypothetical protein [Listeria rocourtiae]MBC1606131.1 hypothetical protein [Listeria rocourtiae]
MKSSTLTSYEANRIKEVSPIPKSLQEGNGDYVDLGKFNQKVKGKSVRFKAPNG